MTIVHAIAEFAQSYMAQARSSGRPRPTFSTQACNPRARAGNRDSIQPNSASAFLRDLTLGLAPRLRGGFPRAAWSLRL